MDVPAIETPRLRLRGHRLSDFPDCAAMWGDAVVTRYIGGRPFTTEETWARFVRYAGFWQLLGYGFWAAEEKATGVFVGELGFANFNREMQPPLGDVPEAGWVFASAVHGKGYATEAMRAAVGWIDGQVASGHTACIIDPGNLQSIRVAEKCGYGEERRSEYKGSPVIVFTRSTRR
jgi:RimJ/RimL family protein N-acetyltransferase